MRRASAARAALDGAKSGSGCDSSVWGEGRIGVDVGDHGLCAGFGGASAYRLLVLDGGEVVRELAGEAALGDDPQRLGLRVGELDVSEIGGEERDGAVERLIEQFAQPRSVAEPSRQQYISATAADSVMLSRATAASSSAWFAAAAWPPARSRRAERSWIAACENFSFLPKP
jgi:hypothetical protein